MHMYTYTTNICIHTCINIMEARSPAHMWSFEHAEQTQYRGVFGARTKGPFWKSATGQTTSQATCRCPATAWNMGGSFSKLFFSVDSRIPCDRRAIVKTTKINKKNKNNIHIYIYIYVYIHMLVSDDRSNPQARNAPNARSERLAPEILMDCRQSERPSS